MKYIRVFTPVSKTEILDVPIDKIQEMIKAYYKDDVVDGDFSDENCIDWLKNNVEDDEFQEISIFVDIDEEDRSYNWYEGDMEIVER